MTNIKKENYITVMSFICSLMIIGLHAFNANTLPNNSITVFIQSVISHGLFTGAVPIFMFTSGYLFYKNLNSISECFKKQKRRVITIVMPFLVWSTFYYLFFAAGNKFLGISMQESVNISLKGMVEGILFYKYCFPLWYLWQLILYIMLAPIIYKILDNKKLSIIILLLIAIAVTLGITSIGFNQIGEGRLNFQLNYFIYYYLGCLMARNLDVFERIKEKVLNMSSLCLSLMYLLFGTLGGMVYQGYIAFFDKRAMIPFISVVLWMLLYNVIVKRKYVIKNENISTMIVYAIHPFVGLIINKLLGMLYLGNMLHYFIWFILTVIGSCITSLLIKRIKPLHWILSGNR